MNPTFYNDLFLLSFILVGMYLIRLPDAQNDKIGLTKIKDKPL